MDQKRQKTINELGRLKQAFAGAEHPGITIAMDIAQDALQKALEGTDSLTAAELTKRMLRAVMDAGFMILHRDELQNTLLAVAQIGKIFSAEDPNWNTEQKR